MLRDGVAAMFGPTADVIAALNQHTQQAQQAAQAQAEADAQAQQQAQAAVRTQAAATAIEE